MPKAKRIELRLRPWGRCLLGVSMGLGVCLVQAQTPTPTPSLGDVVDSAKKAKALEYSRSLNDALRTPPVGGPSAPGGLAVPGVPGPLSSGTPPALPPLPPPAPTPPMLRAIYGVNHLIEAEVVFDGQAYAINSMEPRVTIGPWRFGLVTVQGVHLFQKPLTPKQLAQLSSWTDETSVSVLDCPALGMTKNQCLFLPVIKASVDTPSPARASAQFTNFPPPPPPSPAARERFAR